MFNFNSLKYFVHWTIPSMKVLRRKMYTKMQPNKQSPLELLLVSYLHAYLWYHGEGDPII